MRALGLRHISRHAHRFNCRRLFIAVVKPESAMTALVKDEYDEVSYKVFNIGNANLVPAYSDM